MGFYESDDQADRRALIDAAEAVLSNADVGREPIRIDSFAARSSFISFAAVDPVR